MANLDSDNQSTPPSDNPSSAENKLCAFFYEEDRQCQCYAIKSSRFCINHDTSEQSALIRQNALKRSIESRRENLQFFKISGLRIRSVKDLRRFIAWVSGKVVGGEIDSKRAECLKRLAELYLNTFKSEIAEWQANKLNDDAAIDRYFRTYSAIEILDARLRKVGLKGFPK